VRKVNRILDQNPVLFGLIPLDFIIPLVVCVLIAIIPIWIFEAPLPVAVALFIVTTGSYGLLTASGSHKFLSRLSPPPIWIRGLIPHYSILEEFQEQDLIYRLKAATKVKAKLTKLS
jgi:hypothetical protein